MSTGLQDWMDPHAEVTYEFDYTKGSDVKARYITGGTRPVAGYSGLDIYGMDEGAQTPQHDYQQVVLPGVTLGPGGRARQQQFTYNLPTARPPGAIGSGTRFDELQDQELKMKVLRITKYNAYLLQIWTMKKL